MTEQQRKLYDFLLERKDDDQSPSFSEMADATGTTKGNVHRLVEILEKRGKITRIRGVQRSIRAVPEDPLKGIPSQDLWDELRRRGEVPAR